jgi:hypothetical protein
VAVPPAVGLKPPPAIINRVVPVAVVSEGDGLLVKNWLVTHDEFP